MKAPSAPPPPPPAPDLEAAAKEKARREAEDAEQRRLRGRASTLLTGGAGDASEAKLSAKTLLGS